MHFQKQLFADERKTPVPEFLCNKVTGLRPTALLILKMRLRYECLPVNFAKCFRRPTFVEHLETAAFGNAFFYNSSGRLFLHFRGFSYVLKKIICIKNLLLRILTGKKYRQVKLQRLQKVQIWAFVLLVQQINSL